MAVNEGFRCSPLPAISPARLLAHRPSVTTEGAAPDELLHVSFLGVTTLGWPHATMGRAWIQEVIAKQA
jgi:alkylhydroperoxidase/carboxymuconolactone decarboxylase family protein YurZ